MKPFYFSLTIVFVNPYISQYTTTTVMYLPPSQEMAVLSSTTACAAITSHTTSSSNVNSTGMGSTTTAAGTSTSAFHDAPHSSSLADKIHGLTEKLQALGHHRTDSEASGGRMRTGIPCHLSSLVKWASDVGCFLGCWCGVRLGCGWVEKNILEKCL